MAVRAIRGATQVDTDEREHVLARTRELIGELMGRNKITDADLVSVFFTATPDVASVAPALAARQLGMTEVALICLQEMVVEGQMPRLVRILAHLETERAPGDLENVYLHGTEQLRAVVPPIPAD